MDSSRLNELLVKYGKGTCSNDELVLLYRFFDSYQDEVDIWKEKGPVEKERVRKELEKIINIRILEEETKKKPKSQYFLKIAATVLLLFSIGFLTKMSLFKKKAAVEYEHIVSSSKGVMEVNLNDGSTVWLNRNSELWVPRTFSSAKSREVVLQGEAFFEVASNKERPFVVSTNHIKTKVLGTRFNIREDNEVSEVALVEGSVEVNAFSEKVLLKPMEKAVYQNGGPNLAVTEMDRELELAWMSNVFEFEHTELSRVAIVLGRRFHKKIEFDRPDLMNRKVTGIYKDESLSTILFSVTRAGNLGYKVIDEQHILIFEPSKK